MGHFRLGGFVRYIPYPVVGGFLAGTGSLLAQGGLSVMLDIPLSLGNLPRSSAPERLIAWLPGLIFGVALLLVLRRHQHFLITPGALALITGLFYGTLLITGTPVSEASAARLAAGSIPSRSTVPAADARDPSAGQLDGHPGTGRQDRHHPGPVPDRHPAERQHAGDCCRPGHRPEPRADHGRNCQPRRRPGRQHDRLPDHRPDHPGSPTRSAQSAGEHHRRPGVRRRRCSSAPRCFPSSPRWCWAACWSTWASRSWWSG